MTLMHTIAGVGVLVSRECRLSCLTHCVVIETIRTDSQKPALRRLRMTLRMDRRISACARAGLWVIFGHDGGGPMGHSLRDLVLHPPFELFMRSLMVSLSNHARIRHANRTKMFHVKHFGTIGMQNRTTDRVKHWRNDEAALNMDCPFIHRERRFAHRFG
jgi:hypothetical protein